jgi:hypothetical protein
MCSDAVDFFIYCIEVYKAEKKLSGRQVVDIFDRYGVTDFIIKCHKALHCQGEKAITWDIDEFIANHPQKSQVEYSQAVDK